LLERVCVLRRYQYTSLAMKYALTDAADVGGDGRQAGVTGLEEDAGHAFAVTGEGEKVGSVGLIGDVCAHQRR